jgi:hypothetical protein
MPIYTIFELPTNLTQAQIDAFAYDDDPDNLRDQTSVWFYAPEVPYSWTCVEHDPPCSPEAYHSTRGHAQVFGTDQFKKYIFVNHAMQAIHGQTAQYRSSHADATTAIANWADTEFRVNYVKLHYDMFDAMWTWNDGTGVTMNGGACQDNANVYVSMRVLLVLWRGHFCRLEQDRGHGESGQIGYHLSI